MAPPVIRLGLIGHGTVGSAFATALRHRSELLERTLGVRLHLARVAVTRPALHRSRLHGIVVTDDALQLADDPSLDIVVEASGATTANQWLHRVLDRGATVVTANKFAVASDPFLLAALAGGEPRLQIEASVAAAVPIVRALRDSLAGEEILSIRGVLNGTTTFVLSQVEQGASFIDAVAHAREHGYAEGDALLDLSGADAAAKLSLLCTLAWRRPVPLDLIRVEGISAALEPIVHASARMAQHVRLVASAHVDGSIHAAVRPTVLEAGDPLAAAVDVLNVVELQTALAGPLVWSGAGAGGVRTASALLGDVVSAARSLASQRSARVAA
jgi:homoserine dehydrogenase